MVSTITPGASCWSVKEVVGMQAEEPIRLPSGCHLEDTGHCEIPTNLGATIFQRKRLGGRVNPCLACFAGPLSLFSCFLRRAQGEHPYLRLCLRYIYDIYIYDYICMYISCSSSKTPRQGDAVALWSSLGQLLFHRKFHERRLKSLHQSGG